MSALVVAAHPRPDSFGAEVRRRVVAGLRSQGESVDLLDLYDMEFHPLPTEAGSPDEIALVDHHSSLLRSADALVFVHPTWWGGQPAIVQGWIDRVWRGGVVAGGDGGRLMNIRRLAMVTTHGSPRWVNVVQGEPGRVAVMRGLRMRCHPLCRRKWLACYGIDGSGEEDRRAFLDKVERVTSRW